MSETSMNINNEGTATTTERSDDVVPADGTGHGTKAGVY